MRPGDWSLAMGNPFGLSLDFTPTVTFGLVSGVNRYQPPEGKGTLEYTDCIQVEASINPGNSGGPLFNMAGELIGINGRGSFEKRGRVNSGVGYAISINQIKHFLGDLKVGLDCDHASLGAVVETENEDGDLARMVVRQVLARLRRRPARAATGRPTCQLRRPADVERQPVQERPRHLSQGVAAAAHLPPRNGAARTVLIRLEGTLAESPEEPEPKGPKPAKPKKAGADESPANKLYQAKPGFANYHFNREAQNALKAATLAKGDFSDRAGHLGDDRHGRTRRPQGRGDHPLRRLARGAGARSSSIGAGSSTPSPRSRSARPSASCNCRKARTGCSRRSTSGGGC